MTISECRLLRAAAPARLLPDQRWWRRTDHRGGFASSRMSDRAVLIEAVGRADMNEGATSLEPRLDGFYRSAQEGGANKMFGAAGAGPEDGDVLMVYDSFSCHVACAGRIWLLLVRRSGSLCGERYRARRAAAGKHPRRPPFGKLHAGLVASGGSGEAVARGSWRAAGRRLSLRALRLRHRGQVHLHPVWPMSETRG